MAKRGPFFENRQVTLEVNDVVLSQLEELGRTGLYGNDHNKVAEVVLRVGLMRLIETGVLKPKEWAPPRPDESDEEKR